MHKGESMHTNMSLKTQLQEAWGLTNFKLVVMDGGIFQVIINSIEGQCSIRSKGAVNLKLRVLRVMRWQPRFNPSNFKISISQLWVHILDFY